MSLSIRNGWLDDDNRAYIFFTTNDVMEQMCCGTEKATKMLAELDSEKGIIITDFRVVAKSFPYSFFFLHIVRKCVYSRRLVENLVYLITFYLVFCV